MPVQQRRITIPFIGPSATARNMQVQEQETFNFVTSILQPGAKQTVILDSAPGLVELGAIGDGPCRTPKFVQWRHPTDRTIDTYCVFGTAVVRISVAAGPVQIGTIPLQTTKVRIARGRTQLLFVDGLFGYTYDGATFSQIDDLDFPDVDRDQGFEPTHAVYLDGYFIVNDARTDSFFISDIEDARSWNALEFDAAAVAPDNALAIATTESELWIIGDETSQAFYNSGNAIFPFQIILSATQEVGILAPQTIAESDAGIFFLGTTPEGGAFVYQINGHRGRIISGEEQDRAIGAVPDLTEAVGYLYQQEGRAFYVLTMHPDFPTLVYNIKAQNWETRGLADGSAYRLSGAGLFNRTNIGGSRLGGFLYTLSLDDFTDAGTDLIRRRRTSVQHQNNQLLDWWEVVIDGQAGVGNTTSPGEDPKIRLRYSDDGGNTWSFELVEPLGKQGETMRRAVFRNLGQSRNRIFEVEYSDPVPVTIVAAYARVSILSD